jgi:hypothetical protein
MENSPTRLFRIRRNPVSTSGGSVACVYCLKLMKGIVKATVVMIKTELSFCRPLLNEYGMVWNL